MNRTKDKTQHRKLVLKTEQVVYLTDDMLKNVVGGADVTSSNPISKCNTQCVAEL